MNSQGKPALLSKVEFYLDGSLLDTQYAYPFGLAVDPPDYFQLYADTPVSWEVLAKGYDLEGNIASDSVIGTSAGSANLPKINLLDPGDVEIFNGTEIQLKVVADGDNNETLASC